VRWISTCTSRARNYSRRIALPAIIVQGASPRTGLAGRCRTFCSSTTRPAPPWRRHSLHIFSRSTPLAQSRGPPSTNGGRPRLTLRSRRHAPLCRYRSDRFWLPREAGQRTKANHQPCPPDVSSRRLIKTRQRPAVSLRQRQASAANALTLLMRAARRQGMLRAGGSPYGLGARPADASTHLPGLASWRTAGCAAV
jgi:hypothetical protein